MKLIKFVSGLPEGTSICIGAASGWLFFGTREEYLLKYKEIDVEYFERAKKIFEDAKRIYKVYLPGIKPKKKTYELKPLKRKVRSEERNEKGIYEIHYEPIPFEEAVETWKCKYSQSAYNYAKWNKYWKNYILISDRSILKAYKKKTDVEIGIIISGCENGNYWLRSEWEEIHNGKNEI